MRGRARRRDQTCRLLRRKYSPRSRISLASVPVEVACFTARSRDTGADGGGIKSLDFVQQCMHGLGLVVEAHHQFGHTQQIGRDIDPAGGIKQRHWDSSLPGLSEAADASQAFRQPTVALWIGQRQCCDLFGQAVEGQDLVLDPKCLVRIVTPEVFGTKGAQAPPRVAGGDLLAGVSRIRGILPGGRR